MSTARRRRGRRQGRCGGPGGGRREVPESAWHLEPGGARPGEGESQSSCTQPFDCVGTLCHLWRALPPENPSDPPPGSRGPGWRGACEPGAPTSRAPGEASPFSQLTLTSLLQGHLAPRRGPHGEGAGQRGPSSPLSRPPKPRSEPQPWPACPPGSWSGTSSQNLLGPEAGSICLSPPRAPSSCD